MATSLKLLVLEDSPSEGLRAGLRAALPGEAEVTWLKSAQQAREAAGREPLDGILVLTSGTNRKQVADFLAALGAEELAAPVVVVAGGRDELLAMTALRNGAQECLFEDELGAGLLKRSIAGARRMQRIRLLLLRQQERLERTQKRQARLDQQRSLEQFQKVQEELELRVASRTAQLQKTVSTLHEEVSQRMEAEQELRKVNVRLQMVSECDQAMVWAADEGRLLEEICRILTTVGGYELAWVGLAEQDDAKTVRVAAASGAFSDVIKISPISWNELQPAGRGPTGRVIRSGESLQSRLNDPALAPFWERVKGSGLQSLICMPLKTKSGILGVLTICSRSGEAFGEQETKLLQELAEDLGYGVVSLRSHAQQLKAEKALQESNEVLQRVLDSTQVLLALLGRDFKILRVNLMYARSSGQAQGALVGRNYFEAHPQLHNRVIFQRVVDTGEPFSAFEMPLILSGESARWWNWNLVPVKDSEGMVVGLVLSLLEVTEHRRSREALREVERQAQQARLQLATIVESTDDAIISVRLDGTIMSWNHGARRIWGYLESDVMGKPVTQLLQPRRVRFIREALARVSRGQRVSVFNTQGVSTTGEPLELSITLTALRDTDGTITGASMVVHDITEQRRLEKQVLQVGENERQRIGHDLHDGLGQNLTGLAFLSKVLEQRLSARHMRESKDAAQIASLLNESTALTRSLAHGLVPVGPQPEGLMNALKELTSHVRRYFGVECEFQCEPPVVLEDKETANHLYRIAQEAINNALRHGMAKRVELQLSQKSAGLTLEIRDNGKGMPASAPHGDGMGVQIMKYRAHQIGAVLSIEPGLVGGTIVTCFLPM